MFLELPRFSFAVLCSLEGETNKTGFLFFKCPSSMKIIIIESHYLRAVSITAFEMSTYNSILIARIYVYMRA